LQTTGNASLTSIDGKTPALGTALMAASSPVTVATNDVVSTNLVTIGARTPALGTAVMTGSSPVTIATNDVLVSPIAAVGATAPTSASAVGGIGGTPGVSAPTAVTAGQLVRLWNTLKGALVTRLTGPDDLDLFPASAVPADAVTNAELTSSIRSRLIGFNGTTWDRIRVGVTGAVSAVTGWTNVLPGAQYLAANPTLTDTQFSTLLLTISGFLKTSLGDLIAGENLTDAVLHVMPKAMTSSTGSWTAYNSTATLVGTAGISVKAAAGRLASIRATSTNTTVQHYLLLCDKASAPVANDVAVASVAIPALTAASIATTGVLDFAAAGGKYFSLGVAYAISTTPQKVTLAGALEFAVQAEYA
jgi:hypothetical protein